ncbi:glutathione S-transferase A-like isoform X3 [Amphiprion ocellaris]|uniref:glutathione S-transferase A-like isoform X3 n=1 Tax=Amphiprion ocellaris TaxID=80972 RepID=UPI00241142D9|nr:glutathione S-transferase A-like isoform X3 [Amphiprion ocellaris]
MAKDMTLLWGSGSAPCWRVQIMLEEKKLQGYDQKLLSFEKMEHKSQEVLDINPRGQFKNQGTKLIPDDTDQQALMYQRMFEGLTFYDKVLTVIYYEYFVPKGERHDSAVKRNKEALETELKLWEGYLQKLGAGSYLAGPSFTLADVVVFPTVGILFRFGLSAQRYPKLGEYYGLVKERPSVKASWPPHWVEDPKGDEDTLKDL